MLIKSEDKRDVAPRGCARGTWEELQGNQVLGTEAQKGTLKTMLL